MNHRNTEFYKSIMLDTDTGPFFIEGALGVDRPIEPESPILMGSKGDLTFYVHHAIEAPLSLLRDHDHLLTHTKLMSPAEVRSVDLVELRNSEALITSITSNSGLEARCHVHCVSDRNGAQLKFGGVSSYGNITDSARVLIAASVVAQEHDAGSTPCGEAIARHYKTSGDLNLASTIPFSRMGFFGARTTLEPISFADIHMYDEWTFVNARPHVGCHLMRGKAKDIGPRAWDLLSDWKLAFGKSRMEEENTFFFGKERDDE